nr:MAG: hypothetical protein [Rhabdoviridae sp.]
MAQRNINVLSSIKIITSIPATSRESLYAVGLNILDDYSGPHEWKQFVSAVFLATLCSMKTLDDEESLLSMEGEFNEVLQVKREYSLLIPEHRLLYRDRFAWPFEGVRYIINLKMELSKTRVPGIPLAPRLLGVPSHLKTQYVTNWDVYETVE